MFCPACGQEASEEAKFCPNCGQALNRTGPDAGIHEPAETPLAPVNYAGFWRRFAAFFIDEILVFVIGTGAGAVVGFLLGQNLGIYGLGGAIKPLGGALGIAVGAVTSWLYWAGMESSAKQATVGKMALGLMVTDLQGEPISFGRATGRYFGKFISGLILGVGFMMAGWTARKQALHDIMAGTLVVKKQG